MVFQLAYCSVSNSDITPALLDDILTVSIRNNLREDVTGVLLSHDRMFFQVLEGDRDVVRRRFDRIDRDDRHGAIAVMCETEADSRCFPDWTMGFAGPDEIPLQNSPAQVSLDSPARPDGEGGAREGGVVRRLAHAVYDDFLGRLSYRAARYST